MKMSEFIKLKGLWEEFQEMKKADLKIKNREGLIRFIEKNRGYYNEYQKKMRKKYRETDRDAYNAKQREWYRIRKERKENHN